MANTLGLWSGPVVLSAANFAPPGAPIAAAGDIHGFLNAFTVGNDGALYTKWDATPLWSGPTALTATAFAQPGSNLAAVRFKNSQWLNVVLVDNTGTIEMLTNPGLAWQGPTAMGRAGMFNAGASVAEALQGTNQVHVPSQAE